MKYVNLAGDLLREKTDIAPGANDAFWGMSGKKRGGAGLSEDLHGLGVSV